MSDLFLLSARQMARISPFFPLAHGVPRADDRRVVSGIVYVIRHGLQWKMHRQPHFRRVATYVGFDGVERGDTPDRHLRDR